MKDIAQRIANASVETWFVFLIWLIFAAVAFTVARAMTADHMVRCYYLKSYATEAGTAYKIMGDINWGGDITSFASPDPEKVLSVIKDLNQCSAK